MSSQSLEMSVELHSLRCQVIIQDAYGTAWQKLCGDLWYKVGDAEPHHYRSDDIPLPAKVLGMGANCCLRKPKSG